MVLNQLHDQCNNTLHSATSSTSIAIQCEQLPTTKKCVSQAVQYEPQGRLSSGTQCKPTIQSRGSQYSLEDILVHYKSYSTQCNLMPHVSKSTQCSLEDPSDDNSFQLQKVQVFSKSVATDDNEYAICPNSSHKHMFSREKAAHCLQICAKESQTSGKNVTTNVQKLQRVRPRKKNITESSLFSSIIKQKKNTCASSTTSGVTEMYSFRSDLDSMEENPMCVEAPGEIVKQKKKSLWTPSRGATSISGSDHSLDFSSLYPKMEDTFPKQNWNRKRTLPVQYRSRYTYKEELAVIKYISTKKLYNRVRGISIWQDMEAEMEIDRSWQSLKEHFRKKILPNIAKFELPSKIEQSFCKIIMR